MFDVTGYAVLVTGGSRGIGFGIARVFCEAGAHVVIMARDKTVVNAAVARLNELAARGASVSAVIGDVSSRSACDTAVAAAIARHGRLDVLCANAGILPSATLSQMTPDDIDTMFAVNVKGTIYAVQAATAALAASGHGRVVITSSITGPMTGFPGWAHYAASKAAQLGFMRTAALELAPLSITVNAVLPGNIETEGLAALGPEYRVATEACIPQHRLGSVEDIGYAALYFASREAKFVTGQTIVVDGGQTLPESPAAILPLAS